MIALETLMVPSKPSQLVSGWPAEPPLALPMQVVLAVRALIDRRLLGMKPARIHVSPMSDHWIKQCEDVLAKHRDAV